MDLRDSRESTRQIWPADGLSRVDCLPAELLRGPRRRHSTGTTPLRAFCGLWTEGATEYRGSVLDLIERHVFEGLSTWLDSKRRIGSYSN